MAYTGLRSGLGASNLRYSSTTVSRVAVGPVRTPNVNDLKIGDQFSQAVYRPSAVISGIKVNRMAKGHDNV